MRFPLLVDKKNLCIGGVLMLVSVQTGRSPRLFNQFGNNDISNLETCIGIRLRQRVQEKPDDA
jgi:hypothetical protein